MTAHCELKLKCRTVFFVSLSRSPQQKNDCMMLVISTFGFSFGERGSMNQFINLIVVQLLRDKRVLFQYWSPITHSLINNFCLFSWMSAMFHPFYSSVLWFFFKSFFYSSFGFMILMCMSPISPSSPWLPRDVSGFYSYRMVTATSPAEHWRLVCMIEFWMSWSICYYLVFPDDITKPSEVQRASHHSDSATYKLCSRH